MILHYFKKKENIEKGLAAEYYNKVLKESSLILSKNTFFKYKNYNTSFEIITIYLIIYIKKNIYFKNENYKLINDELISIFIRDLDDSLRNIGIGDMSIGKYVKSYVKKFYFRIKIFPDYNDFFSKISLTEYLKKINIIKNNEFSRASNVIISSLKDLIN